MRSLRVKVCGVTTVEDARLAARLGADFIGLNFYRRSPRFVEAGPAARIADAVRGQVKLAGVFVSSTAEEVERLDRAVGLDVLQFHGDESPGFIARFGGRALPAVRWAGAEDAARIRDHARAFAVLVERRHAARFGGTGEPWSYAEVAMVAREVRVLLAGGLGPDNVRAAIAAVAPWGVDVCSRVERAPGVKDEGMLRRFFEEVG